MPQGEDTRVESGYLAQRQASAVGLSRCLAEPGEAGPTGDSGTLRMRSTRLVSDPLDGWERDGDRRAGRPALPLQRLPAPDAALWFRLPLE